jgi:putative transposase
MNELEFHVYENRSAEGRQVLAPRATELKQRGLQDVRVCCVDGPTGCSEAIEAVYPQTCMGYQVRSSLRLMPYRDKKEVAADPKKL